MLIRLNRFSDDIKLKIRQSGAILDWVESKLSTHTMHALELFGSLIPHHLKINMLEEDETININDIAPAFNLLSRISQKVIEDNKYTQSELRFLERLAVYDQKSIIEKLKVMDNQTVRKAGSLFATVVENNRI